MKDNKRRNLIIIIAMVILAALSFYIGYTYAGNIDVSNDVLLISSIIITVIGIVSIVIFIKTILKKSK